MFRLSPISLALALFGVVGRTFEVALEWDVVEGTKGITAAMSLLRFANDTSPPGTEWVGIGWSDGSMSLQHRNDSKSLIVMQISPPTSAHQVILGKTSDLSEVRYRPTRDGPSQVFLESPVELDATLPYYFKVAAHHNLKDNRTTYEGLYSVGQNWVYMGSIILQHPNDGKRSELSALSSALDDSSDSRSQGAVSAGEDNAPKSSAFESSLSIATLSTAVSSTSTSSLTAASSAKRSKHGTTSTMGAEEESLSNEIEAQFSSARTSDDHSGRHTESDSESERDEDKDEDRDEERDEERDEDRDEDSEREKDRDDARDKGKDDDDSSGKEDTPHRGKKNSPGRAVPHPNIRHNKRHGVMTHAQKRLYELELEPDLQIPGVDLRKTLRESFMDFVRSRIAGKHQAADFGDDDDDDDSRMLSLIKGALSFPDYPAFPKIYSGVKRLPGGDSSHVRAGVFKKFQLRDRLGSMYFVNRCHAYSYDGNDEDKLYVRHYFMSASYLVAIDGTNSLAKTLGERGDTHGDKT